MSDMFKVFSLQKALLPAELFVGKVHPRTRALRIRYYRAMSSGPQTAKEIAAKLGIDHRLCYQQLMVFENQGLTRKARAEWGNTTWEITV